ncbi:MAG TPA: hypothetical protein DDY77_01440, partial [Clostridiales bacterium]|nr:hypothetical protein [Clostridiales bacterium]
LGFLVGSLKIKRVFTVYIDGAEATAPSDLKGMWDVSVFSEGKTTDELAAEIVDLFIHEQTDELNENKIELVTDISRLRGLIEAHRANPVHFESEIAELILLYCQSTYMFGVMGKGKKLLTEILNSGEVRDDRVILAINSSLCYYEICENLQQDKDGTLYLPKEAYEGIKTKLLSQIETVEKLGDGEFKRMFLMLNYDYVTFANMMYYLCAGAEGDLEFRDFCVEKCIETCEKFRSFDPDKNDQLAALYESYGYRNAALYFIKTDRKEKAMDAFDKSRAARYKLFRYFRNKDMDKNIFEQIKMEYYLALTDDLDLVYGVEKKRRLRELEDYLEDAYSASLDKNYLVRKIEKILNSVSNDEKKTETTSGFVTPLGFTMATDDEVVKKAFTDNDKETDESGDKGSGEESGENKGDGNGEDDKNEG